MARTSLDEIFTNKPTQRASLESIFSKPVEQEISQETRDKFSKLQENRDSADRHQRNIGRIKEIGSGATFGLSTLLGRNLTPKSYEEAEKGAEQLGGAERIGLNILGGITGAGVSGLGKAGMNFVGRGGSAGSKIGRMAGLGAVESAPYGAIEEKGNLEDKLKAGAVSGVIGAGLGAGLKGLGEFGKVALPFGAKKEAMKIASEVVAPVGRKFEDIASSGKGVKVLKSAIKADDGIAEEIAKRTEDLVVNSAEKTKKIVEDIAGAENIKKGMQSEAEAYGNILNKEIDSSNIYNKDTLMESLDKVTKKPETYGIDNANPKSLKVAQAVKEDLDDQISSLYRSGENKKASNLNKIRKEFVSNLDTQVPEYASRRKEYGKFAEASNVLNDMTDFNINMFTDEASNKLNLGNIKSIENALGSSKAKKIKEALLSQRQNNKRYKSLYDTANNQITKADPEKRVLLREALESAGSVVGGALDATSGNKAVRRNKLVGELLLGRGDITQPKTSNIKDALSLTLPANLTVGTER